MSNMRYIGGKLGCPINLVSVAFVVAAMLPIMVSCTATPTPSDDTGTDSPVQPDVEGNDDGVGPADAAVDENPDSVEPDDDLLSIADVDADMDSDGDGILDEFDECADTPDGTDVDAVGCPFSTPDSGDEDQDGVPDNRDECADTLEDAPVDERGCAVGQLDNDGDGVSDEFDLCADTPTVVNVDENGCAESQRDEDRDGVMDDRDRCAGTAPRTLVDESGCPISQRDPPAPPVPPADTLPVCGNGLLESGEECDDGNVQAGDGCDPRCLTESPANNDCDTPLAVGDGESSFDSTGATTDGPDEAETCNFFESARLEADVWFCYTSSCSGQVVASLCGSDFDTKMAVYSGCGCPSTTPVGCSDDDCGVGAFNSRVAFPSVQGQSYMIRIGGFQGDQGAGTLTISCGADPCSPDAGECFVAHESTGCEDEDCCGATCSLDPYCCDVAWDDVCAGKAEGLCMGSFSACAAGAGSCDAINGSPGCDSSACCNSVCLSDPFCCVDTWDDLCAEQAANVCDLE